MSFTVLAKVDLVIRDRDQREIQRRATLLTGLTEALPFLGGKFCGRPPWLTSEFAGISEAYGSHPVRILLAVTHGRPREHRPGPHPYRLR